MSYPCLDVAFESLSGELLTVYVSNTTISRPSYTIWTPDGGGGGEFEGPDVHGNGNTISLEPDPLSDGMLLLVQNNHQELVTSFWDGDSFSDAEVFEEDTDESMNQPFSFLWMRE